MSNDKKSIEIELQVKITNSEDLVTFLQKNAIFIRESHQIDTYYKPAHRDFITVRPVKEWLRLRDSSGKYSINYKNWHYDDDGRSHFADEYETKIDNLEQLQQIFNALNMEKVVVVDKARNIWQFQDYEISLDTIKGLGDFVEIEYKGEDTNKKHSEITKEMIDFLKSHDVGEIYRNYVGYPFQLLFPDEVIFEKF